MWLGTKDSTVDNKIKYMNKKQLLYDHEKVETVGRANKGFFTFHHRLTEIFHSITDKR